MRRAGCRRAYGAHGLAPTREQPAAIGQGERAVRGLEERWGMRPAPYIKLCPWEQARRCYGSAVQTCASFSATSLPIARSAAISWRLYDAQAHARYYAALARETNLAESVFVLPASKADTRASASSR